ncbi:MAG: hypothetical protein J5622_05180 [Firmicutes bacterium]|nr:hypothetical protein [Bacillota bacterium]
MEKFYPSKLLHVKPCYLKTQVRKRLRKLGLNGDCDDYTTLDSVLSVVGEKPEPTDLREPILCIRDGLPPYAKNFYWGWKFKTELINDILAFEPKKRNRDWLMATLSGMSDDEIRHARKYGLPKKRELKNDYSEHIGRTFGTLKVVSVSSRESDGVVYYIYTVRCNRCGAYMIKRASLFIKGKYRTCKHCGYVQVKRWKNSAVSYTNRYGRYAPKFKQIVNPDPLARLHMAEYLGEYTVYHGTPNYMEAVIDADLLGITI